MLDLQMSDFRSMATVLEPEPAPPGFKAYRRGTHRTVDPATTLARVQPYLARMGITRIANVTGLDRIGVPVVMVCRPNSRSLAVSQGKGLTLDAAKASGVMEAIELYHGERIELPLKLGSVRDLGATHRLVDLDRLPRRADSRFHFDLPILWIEGRNLLADEPVWLPYEVVHTRYALPLPSGSGCFAASSNGLASGNHLVEAINHGIAEVVERDSTAIWQHLGRKIRDRTRVELSTIEDHDCIELLDKLRQAEFAVAVWDTTTDIGIASFYCLITDRRHENAHSGAGAGAHASRAVALLRALTEAIQVRTTYITGSRDDLRPDEFTPPAIEQKLRRAHALMARPETGRDFREVPTYESETVADDLGWILARLQSAGVEEVIAVDLTRPDMGVPVARVVIPGLEGPDDQDRYVPGPRVREVLGTAR
jgi:ribosomal protein S12 methylthiotransferase accessory factor